MTATGIRPKLARCSGNRKALTDTVIRTSTSPFPFSNQGGQYGRVNQEIRGESIRYADCL